MPKKAVSLGLRDYLWPARLYLWQLVRAAFQVPGITVTVLAGGFSIGFPLVFPFIGKNPALAPPLLIVLSISALGLLPLMLLSGAIALWTADPETYARIVIAGRSAKEVLFVTSRHIDSACRRTLKDIDSAEELCENISKNLFEHKLDRIQISKMLQRLRRLVQRQHVPLLRLEAMKLIASEQLGIPKRRLCDHVFQYSPAMHRDRLQKYLGNWEAIEDLHQIDESSKQRFRKLMELNRAFTNNTHRRRGYQRQIFLNRDLHPYIVQLASLHSTSGALLTYAAALKFLAATGQSSLERTRGNQESAVKEIENRLRFLHRKQRAHPGFDLHALLRQALVCMGGHHGSFSEVERVLEALDGDPSASAIKACISEEGLAPFAILPSSLAGFIAASREKIAQRFEKLYAGMSPSGTGSRYIVSHGYSKTVLAALKRILPTNDASALPRFFFILAEEQDSFDTRVMEYELKENRDSRTFNNVAAGNVHHLLGILEPGDAVLIILGAECFDTDRRVVHPRGIVRRLKDLLEELEDEHRQIGTLVAVLAESYKHHKTSLTANTHFYGQHFDRIDLYDESLIHLIVTDQGTFPEDWEAVVKNRLRTGRG